MITFFEYSNNLMQIDSVLQSMERKDYQKNSKLIKTLISPALVPNLPENTKEKLSHTLIDILSHDIELWDSLGHYTQPLWNQHIRLPSKSLGKELVNWISAKVMKSLRVDFFLSYESISKGNMHRYVNGHPRFYINRKDYSWGTLRELSKSITEDYTQHFNNRRERFSNS